MAKEKTIAKAKAKTGSTKQKAPNATDVYVGAKVRQRRLMLSMSQEKLGDALGLTFQQVQKYEKGTNRIGASRLQQIATILQTSVSFFLDGAPEPTFNAKSTWKGGQSTGVAPTIDYTADFMATTDGLALMRGFMRIKDAKLRRSIVVMVDQIAPEIEEQPKVDGEHEVLDFQQAKRKARK